MKISTHCCKWVYFLDELCLYKTKIIVKIVFDQQPTVWLAGGVDSAGRKTWKMGQYSGTKSCFPNYPYKLQHGPTESAHMGWLFISSLRKGQKYPKHNLRKTFLDMVDSPKLNLEGWRKQWTRCQRTQKTQLSILCFYSISFIIQPHTSTPSVHHSPHLLLPIGNCSPCTTDEIRPLCMTQLPHSCFSCFWFQKRLWVFANIKVWADTVGF